MNRPIFIVVIGYIIGIIWGLYFKASIALLYAFLAMSYFIINFQYKKKRFRILSIKRYFRYIKLIFKINVIITIIISSFISNSIIKYNDKKYSNLYLDKEEVQETGIIVSNKKEREYSNRYKVKIKNIYFYLNVDKKIELEYGDKIEIIGQFKEPQSARNYKGFDYKQYLKTLKIYGTIDAEKIELLEKNCGDKLMQVSNKLFLKIKNNIEKTYNKEISGIILGIMLGDTEDINEELKEEFSKSNISHVLAISGMHISYIIYLVTNSTKDIFGKRKSKIIACITLLLYMFVTGFSVSIVRAGIMGIINCMAFVVYRKSDTINSISIAALITLINNPYSITGISFLLTYGGTMGIIIFKPTIERILKSIKIKNRKWKYVFIKIQRKCEKIIEIISVTMSAQIVIAPVMILNFNNIGISFLITNLLLSFIIGIIVMGGFIQIIISFISIKVAIYIAKIIQIPTYILIFISKIHFGNFKVITPDLYQVILYYIFIFILNFLYKIFRNKYLNSTQIRVKNIIYLIKYKIKPYKNKIKYTTILLMIICICISKMPHDLKIFFIDVGQGDASLIITPNDKTILIDGGGSDTYDVGENILVPYLLDRRIKIIDYIIISHFDQDHVGGILTVLQELKVKKVIIAKQGEDSEQYEEFQKITQEKNINVVQVKKGDIINIDKEVKIKILFPTDDLIKENILNNNSIVAKLEYKDFKMLFTGDIESTAENELIKMYSSKDLKADIIKVPHHRFEDFINKRVFKIGTTYSCFNWSRRK